MSFYGIFGSYFLNKLNPGIAQGDLDAMGDHPWTGNWLGMDWGDYQVALFTGSSGSVINQRPWVVGSVNLAPNGFVYAFNGSTWVRELQPKIFYNLPITSVTDHCVVAGGYVFWWTQDIDGHSTGNAYNDWQYVAGPTPLAPIAQIAYAPMDPPPNSYGSGNNPMGPSNLWALDAAHHIYEWVNLDNNGVVK